MRALAALFPRPRPPARLQGPRLLGCLAAIALAPPSPASGIAPCAKDGTGLPAIALEAAAEGLQAPVHAAHAGDGSGRLFIVEQAGLVKAWRAGRVLPKPFLDIRKKVRSGGEMGLLSVAFHPRYPKDARFFVNYTSKAGGLRTVVSEFRVGPDPDLADPESERVLFTVAQPYSNHNGGQNAFGPDGRLYIGMGDGGSGEDPHDNGQRMDTWLGKMLRLDVDAEEPKPEIYAWGLRNPWRFSFDPVTKLLYAADVGQDHWEEIDVVEKGKNYGWRVMEGFHCTPGIEKNCSTEGFELPIHEYGRKDGISVTGGFVYRGRKLPGLCGAYVFGDYGSGRVWGLRYDLKSRRVSAQGLLADTGISISSFGEGEDRELYLVDHDGRVLRLIAAGPEKGVTKPHGAE